MKNILENLELKLLQTKKENAEKLNKIETEFKKEFGAFLDTIIWIDNLWFNRYINVAFQLERLDNKDKNNKEIFLNSVKKALELFPINQLKKEIFLKKIKNLWDKKEKINDIFIKKTSINKDKNFPIIEDLIKYWELNQDDLLKISLKYKEKKDFLDAISILSEDKKELIKAHYYELNDYKSEKRIESFQNDFSSEIKKSKYLRIYPKILRFIWKNYWKLRLRKKVESKKDRLRRMFKIAFLKLYRLKYSWIDITKILNKIDSLDDIDEMISLLLKFFEVLKQNPKLEEDYIIWEEIEEVEEIKTEAEENKEKILFLEKNTIKVNDIFEKVDKKLSKQELDELLDEEVDLLWNEFKKRTITHAWILNDNLSQESWEQEDNEEDENLEEIDIEEYYEELKNKQEKLEKKKIKLFLNWEYDKLDELNDELLKLMVKMEKLDKILEEKNSN